LEVDLNAGRHRICLWRWSQILPQSRRAEIQR